MRAVIRYISYLFMLFSMFDIIPCRILHVCYP